MGVRQLVAAAAVVAVASCGTASDLQSTTTPTGTSTTTPTGARAGTPAADADCQPAPVDRSLPTQEVYVDEDGPGDLAGAWAASDVVVVGTVTCVRGGARFLGGDQVEDPGGGWEEVVELDVEVVEAVSGRPARHLQVAWLGYTTSAPSRGARTAMIEVAGVVVPSVGQTYLLFLVDQGEPWGVQPVSTQVGFLQVVDGEVAGQVPTGLASHRGRPLEDVVAQARIAR